MQTKPPLQPTCTVLVRRRSGLTAHRVRAVLRHERQSQPHLGAKLCAAAGQRVAHSLRQLLPGEWFLEGGDLFDFELACIVEKLESIRPYAYPNETRHQALDELNENLAHLLDWAESVDLEDDAPRIALAQQKGSEPAD